WATTRGTRDHREAPRGHPTAQGAYAVETARGHKGLRRSPPEIASRKIRNPRVERGESVEQAVHVLRFTTVDDVDVLSRDRGTVDYRGPPPTRMKSTDASRRSATSSPSSEGAPAIAEVLQLSPHPSG